MAKKKKAKKAKKKKVKARTAKPKKVRETILDKIARIRDRVPHIEPTGEILDETTGEVLFRFTEAQHVFKIYRFECQLESLIWRPYCAVGIQPVVVPFARGVDKTLPFCIEDIKTHERIVGWGSGGGSNADWSGNTAHTRALKQFLLTTFQTTWDDPEHLTYAEQKKLMKQELLKEMEADGTLANIEQMRFWTQEFPDSKKQKGASDASTGRKNTGSRKRSSRKKN